MKKHLFMRIAAVTAASAMLIGTTAWAEPAPVQEEAPATDSAIVQVEDGWYLGTKEDGVYRFVGMKYGEAERFHTAEKPQPHTGLHTATTYGNSCPADESADNPTVPVTAYMTPNGYYTENEDCLYINVWSPSLDETDQKAVLFFIHGGGFVNGSGNELIYYDGANFARTQDMVFVSVNTRLNVLGYTDLSAYGEEYQSSGNLGQEDLVLALEWVRDNIAQFGGDPSNVTILGQSGGGTKVTSLLACEPAQGLFSKAIICSGGGAVTRTQEESRAAGTALVERCKETYGVETDEEALQLLETMDYNDLKNLSADLEVGQGPTIDGYLLVENPFDEETLSWTSMSDHIPMIIDMTFAEMSGSIKDAVVPALVNSTTDADPEFDVQSYIATFNKDYMTEEYKEQVLIDKYGDDKDAVVEAFEKAYPELEPFDVTRINTRNNNMAIARANSNEAPTYQAVFAYEFPFFGGTMGWHTGGDLPFIFNNVHMLGYMIAGDEAGAHKLADTASAMYANFCKTGDPSMEDLTWPAFTTEEGATMIFTVDSEVRNYHDRELFEIMPSSSGSAASQAESAEEAPAAEDGESAEGESAESEAGESDGESAPQE